jgi:hypothetical protein
VCKRTGSSVEGKSACARRRTSGCRYADLPLGTGHYRHAGRRGRHAGGESTPKDREKIDWKLLTDLTVRSCLDAIEKLEWYAHRWKVETFHKILKSGCRAEEAKLRTAERLVNLIAILTILSWRIFWITMLNTTRPDAAPTEAFTDLDLYLLDELVPNKSSISAGPSLSHYIVKLARLGG